MWSLAVSLTLLNTAVAGPRPPSVGSATSDLFPLTVHWQSADQEAKAMDVLAYAELSWQVQVVEMGFRAPQLPDTEAGPELDLYLRYLGDGSAFAAPESWNDAVPGDGYSSVSAFMVIDAALPSQLLGSYTAHEFNHVLHFSMDFLEPSLPLWEAVATASQSWTLGAEGDWDAEVPTFQEIPWAPAILGDSYAIYYDVGLGYYYEYGAALWVMHLDEVVGDGDGSAGPLLWQATANEGTLNEPDALDAFVSVAGGDYGRAMNDLARTRWLVDDQWDDRGLAAAELWTDEFQVPAAQLTLENGALDQTVDPPLTVTGQGFHELNTAALMGSLTVSVGSGTGLQSALLVLIWTDDGGVDEAQVSGDNPVLDIELAGIERVMIAVSNLGPLDYDGDSDPYVSGDQRLVLRHTDPPAQTPTTPTPTDPSTDKQPLNGEPSARCGCSTTPVAPHGFLMTLVLGLRRRRSR